MSTFTDMTFRLFGRNTSDEVLLNTLPAIPMSYPRRSIGLAGDDLTISVPESSWPPSGWDVSRPMGVTFGIAGSTVTLDGYRVRSIRPETYGSPHNSAGAVTVRSLLLHLATMPGVLRDGRGGVIRERTLNPLLADGDVDTASDDYMTNSELVALALAEIGFAHDALPASLDTFRPPGPLDWGNASAINELEALLARINHIAVFNNAGTKINVVKLPLAGETITVPSPIADHAEPYQLYSSPAARATNIVITSGRTRTTMIAKRSIEHFEWVWHDDRTGRWLNAAQTATLYPSEIYPNETAEFRLGPSTERDKAKQFNRLFTALRMDDETFSVARRLVTVPKGYQPISGVEFGGVAAIALARFAVEQSPGYFVNEPPGDEDTKLRVDGVKTVHEDGVFVLPDDARFVRMAGGHGGYADASALTFDDLDMVFAFEANFGDFITDYFAAGWKAEESGGSVTLTPLDESQLDAALNDPLTVRINADFLARVCAYDFDTEEIDALNDTYLLLAAADLVKARASADLAQSGVIEMRGTHNIEPGAIGGAVSSVSWDIRENKTILSINQHEVPDSIIERLEVNGGRSFVSGIGRSELAGSSAGLSDVRQDSTPGDGSGGAGAAGAGDIRAGAARRGASNAVGPKHALAAPSPGGRRPLSANCILAKLMGSSVADTNQWAYQWAECKPGSTQGSFDAITDGRSSSTHGPAFNAVEVGGVGTILANGIDTGNAPAGWEVQPAPEGVVVQLWGPFDPDGDPWWAFFGYTNSIDGACPE